MRNELFNAVKRYALSFNSQIFTDISNKSKMLAENWNRTCIRQGGSPLF